MIAYCKGLKGKTFRPYMDMGKSNIQVQIGYMRINCPANHDLYQDNPTTETNCNVCLVNKKKEEGSTMYGCAMCNFNICENH